ncbi:MAG: Uma2 family endonuclease [Cyanobacteria bacterium P01_H01_bin.121]
MLVTPPKALQSFLQQPNIDGSPAWELLESGERQKPMPTSEHSELQFNLVTLIRLANKGYKAGQELRCNIDGLSIVPDIAVIKTEQYPQRGHYQAAPDWIIEIRSPDQSIAELTSKVIYCLQHGSELGWLIDPQRSRIMVWEHDDFDILTGDSVPRSLSILELSVQQILALQD